MSDLLNLPSTSSSHHHHHHSGHSSSSNSSGSAPCVTLDPPHGFDIDAIVGVDQSLQLRITNITDQLIAFKVKTTSPTRYLVKPAQDTIPAGESRVCHIIVTKFTSLPDPSDPKAGRDKFSVQNMRISSLPESSDALAKLWKEVELSQSSQSSSSDTNTNNTSLYNSTRLRCRLVVPKTSSSNITSSTASASLSNPAAPRIPPKPHIHVSGHNNSRSSGSGGDASLAGFMSSSSSSFFTTTSTSSSTSSRRTARDDHDHEVTIAEYRDVISRQREHDELLNFLVKMTTENATLKQTLVEAKQRLANALTLQETAQRKLQSLDGSKASHTHHDDSHHSHHHNSDLGIDGGDGMTGKVKKIDASHGIPLTIWQLLLLIVVFFIVGRVLA